MKAPQAISIRSRLLLLVLLVLLPAIGATLWIVVQTYTFERQTNERLLIDSTRTLSLLVDRELTQRATLLRSLATSQFLNTAPALTPAALEAFDQQARRLMVGLGGWLELRAPGVRLLDTRLPADTRPQGLAAVETSALAESALALPLNAGPPRGQPYAAWVLPVHRNGMAVLNLMLTIVPAELQRIVDAQHLPADWTATVLDTHGTIVARHPGGSAYTGRLATPELKARLAHDPEALVEALTIDGAPVVGYHSTSSQGWTYLTAMPRAQFVGALPGAVAQVAVGALALLALAVLGAVWVSRSIAIPVTALKEAAAAMQSGQTMHWRPTGIVECEEVAAALMEASLALRNARSELERQVAEAVTHTRWAEQRASQSQRVEALGRLTGGLAHDFNNLLGVISNSTHLMQRLAGADEIQAPAAAVLRAVDAGSRLVQHLLRFAGRQAVRPRTVDLAQFLPEVLELMKTVLGRRVEITVAIAAGTHRVTVDPNELELSLINLALNARDAIQASGHVWLAAANAEAEDTAGLADGDYVVLSVSDDGAGIDDAVSERAFEPFFSTKPVGQASGLGLSQVHGFCVQAGGAARLASTPGLGTTVSLVLPASRSAAPVAEAALPQLPTGGVAGRRVLLVEDNPELGDITAALLESYGGVVVRAGNPQEALEALASERPFDAVLSDVVMPGEVDGIALARQLRREKPELPVVLISGYSHALAQARDFVVLRKPCTPEEMLGALQQAITAAASVH